MQENNKDLVLNQELNANDLESVSGGADNSQKRLHCPIHFIQFKVGVTYYDSGLYIGKNLTRYRCSVCNRLYSQSQIERTEDLTIDYTNIKYD